MLFWKKKKVTNEEATTRRMQVMFDAMPFCANFWDGNLEHLDCNQAAVKLFELRDKREYSEKFFQLSPEYQPCGKPSREKAISLVKKALEEGYCRFEWMHQMLNGEPIPCEVTLVRTKFGDDNIVVGYTRDMREENKMKSEIEQKNHLLKTVTPVAMTLLNASDDEKFEDSIIHTMEHICKFMDVDGIGIWQNEMINGELHFLLKCRHPSEAGAQEAQAAFPYSVLPGWKGKFLNREWINSPFKELSPAEQEFFAPYNVKSILMIPLFLQDHFWGLFTVDCCRRERIFKGEEINIFRFAGLMMANTVNREDILAGYNRDLSAHKAMLAEMQKVKDDLRLARDAAEAASFTQTAFLANMSHEIRTAMSSIMGFSELAMDATDHIETRDYLGKIQTNTEWLLQIINDILDVSKIESGKMELENIPFDMCELFTDCRTLILPKACEKGIMLYFYADPSVGSLLLGDPTRLRQVLMNLLSNAVRFTNTGIVKFLAKIEKRDENAVSIHFTIRDSGIGMSSEQIGKIFEPFIQGNVSAMLKYGGSGLGLAITKSIIELMGGTLFVDSTPGVGSKFSFELVFDTIESPGDEMVTDKILFDEFEKPVFEGEVLLCEDNTMNQQVICEHLARVGLKTVVAENGRIGMEIVQRRIKESQDKSSGKKQFDLIFMDIHMPEVDGLDAAAKISELGIGIPIIASTANILYNDKKIYRASGMNDCLNKPFTSQELWRCLLKYLTPVRRGSGPVHYKNAPADQAGDGQGEQGTHGL